jgi:hypothetical protein
MDAIVEQALAKWPNVPHCYGWLALDARGNWRMRNEHAQAHDLPGDKITQPTLRGFINRNYTSDEQGRWYFQNGPQRVYVDLEVAPYIAHTEPTYGFVLQTGTHLSTIDSVWLSDSGKLFLQGEGKFGLLDDRDLTQCLSNLLLEDENIADEKLMKWLEQQGASGPLSLQYDGKKIAVNYIEEAVISEQFKFVNKPRPTI